MAVEDRAEKFIRVRDNRVRDKAACDAAVERDRYREALEQIAEAGPEYAKRSYRLVAIARAALDRETR